MSRTSGAPELNQMQRLGWLNLANAVTLSRIPLGLICLVPLALMSREALWAAFAVMILAELTDLFDGMIARARNQVTAAGKILDPMADSIYRLTIFAAFVQNGWMPAWLLCVFIIRDVAVAYIRIVGVQSGVSPASRFSGKAKAVAQAGAQLLVVAAFASGLDNADELAPLALYAAAATTLYSLLDYAGGMLKGASGKAERNS